MGETKWEKGVEIASCDFLRFPAVFGSKPLPLRIKDQICKNLRKSSTSCRFSLLVSPPKNSDHAIDCDVQVELQISRAIGKPESCDQMAIGHQKTALSEGILAIEVSVIRCDR